MLQETECSSESDNFECDYLSMCILSGCKKINKIKKKNSLLFRFALVSILLYYISGTRWSYVI